MRGCYRPLLVFAPSLDNPQLVQEFNQLKAHAIELKSRSVLYVPIVPEGHNQPIPGSKVPTARLSEDELAAMRHRFKVEPPDFLVILIGKDGEEKLSNKTPVPVDQLEAADRFHAHAQERDEAGTTRRGISPPAPLPSEAINSRPRQRRIPRTGTMPHRLRSKQHREVP